MRDRLGALRDSHPQAVLNFPRSRNYLEDRDNLGYMVSRSIETDP